MKEGKTRSGLILQIGKGFGEIAPLPGFSKETLEEAVRETLLWMRGEKEPSLPSVCFGISCAKTDLRSVRLPLCALGPKEGFSHRKLKLGHLTVEAAVALVKEQKGAVLRLDCNRAWSLSQALAFASHFRATDFAYIEEPVRTTEELIAFSKTTGFPIALDESIGIDWSSIPTLKAIIVKPTLVGRVPAVPKQLDLVLSSAYESGLGLLHIAKLWKKGPPIGLDTYDAFEEDLLTCPIRTANGFFSWEKEEPLIDFSKLQRMG